MASVKITPVNCHYVKAASVVITTAGSRDSAGSRTLGALARIRKPRRKKLIGNREICSTIFLH